MKQVIVGSFERVTLPGLGLQDVLAKVDTGADSGAIHCTEITVTKNAEGQDELRCYPAGDKTLMFMTTDFKTTAVRSATGHRVPRYIINTQIIVGGLTYDLRIGVSDRSDMKCQVLLGRRFLQEQRILVDVGRNAQYYTEGSAAA